MNDLELSFCCDEDCMGKLETHELVPGGKAIAVTTENRYVFFSNMVALFHPQT